MHLATGGGGRVLGVIADDFTGATDVANVLSRAGATTVVVPGTALEHAVVPPGADAAVVALKSRTAFVGAAVDQTLAAHRFLAGNGCRRFYLKYCSTFDSTPVGNIGPAVDALMEAVGVRVTVATPAYPATSRTLYQGHLFVGERLLSESSMRYHPLTPMTDSDVRRLLEPQTSCHVTSVSLQAVRIGADHLRTLLGDPEQRVGSDRTVFVIDAISDEDLLTIATATRDWPLLTGSAGLAGGLASVLEWRSRARPRKFTVHDGGRVILAGSLSAATRRQVGFARQRLPGVRIDAERLLRDPHDEERRLLTWALGELGRGTAPVMVYSASDDDPPAVGDEPDRLGQAVEECLAGLAEGLVAHGSRQILVAGGETSGAVVERLGVRTMSIGPEIAPGVPWTSAERGPRASLNLGLKSGNFGSDSFLVDAWTLLDRFAAEGPDVGPSGD